MSNTLQPSSAYRVLGVQTAIARKVMMDDRAILTAIHKTAVTGAVAVKRLGLEGDEQADLSVHGGLEKAIYAYPSEHYPFWETHSQRNLPFGSMGENLTLAGLLETDVWGGDILRFPHCVLSVSQPREPCYKFNHALGFNTAVKAMAQSGFCGFYLCVEEIGTITAGESFELIAGSRRERIPTRFAAKLFKHLR